MLKNSWKIIKGIIGTRNSTLNIMGRGKFIVLSLFVVSCSKRCSDQSELGSKNRPLKLILNGDILSKNTRAVEKELVTCIEKSVGFRVMFETGSDDIAISTKLAQPENHFGILTPLGAVEAESSFDFSNEFILSNEIAPLNRTLILGKAETWKPRISNQSPKKDPTSQSYALSALAELTDKTIVYLEKQDILGFLVPRQILMRENVYPGEAFFVSDYGLVLQTLDNDLALAGPVSEIFAKEEKLLGPNQDIFPGQIIGNYIILAVSPSTPASVLVSRKSLNHKVKSAFLSGFKTCSKLEEGNKIYSSLFGGRYISPPSASKFDLFRDILYLKENFPTILEKSW